MRAIESIYAREILDSRGNPTIEVELKLRNSLTARASVPSGASTGKKEALELRDKDLNRYLGRGVSKAIANVNETIAPYLCNREYLSQVELDNALRALDGTDNKSNLGANAILGVSLAFSRAMAISRQIPLFKYINQELNEGWHADISPSLKDLKLMFNIINGGRHADNNLAIQEIMVIVQGRSPSEQVRVGAELFHHLRKILLDKNLNTAVGDEGGYAPSIDNPKSAIELVKLAIKRSGYKLGQDIVFAIDAAANEFYHEGNYVMNQIYSNTQLIEYYEDLLSQYPIVSVEDPFTEDDHKGWQSFTKKLGSKVNIVGDDLFATNPALLEKGVKEGLANSILIKLNQIGTLSETLDTIMYAKKHGYTTVISHRSGETEDPYIAHLAVATGSQFMKSGSLSRSERTCKYNELIRIAEEL